MLQSINPSTGALIREYPETSAAGTATVLAAAERAYRAWHVTPIDERSRLMHRAAALLREEAGRHAALMAAEMGKPAAQGRAEAEKCAWVCDYFADHAERFLAPEPVATDASRSYITFRPVGPILAVMPWNFPYWQVFRFAAPALMAGNAAVLKHASNVSGCSLAIGDVFRAAGFPEGLFSVLLLGSARVASVIDAREIRAVTLTGSGPAGRAVAAAAGHALKKTVLELGGSDPYVLLEDADLDAAAATCAAARVINSGQSCIAAKRFIVVRAVRNAFERRFVEAMRAKRMGDPMTEGVDLGPQARHDLRDQLHAQTVESVRRGARLLLGGEVPPGPGAFYPPTVLTNVRPGMPAYDEELFGPVASVIEAADEEEAMRIANDTPFGLGAAIFSRDVARAERLAAEALEAGSCFVNASVKSDPRLPFGGIKESGYGRELSHFGIREFVNIKTVYVT
jgi:succinate-semialdehyde dehydrogenase/glutarate-semialdehyde dehydrogenase